MKSRSEVIRSAWESGVLFYKLDTNQREMYWAFRESKHPKFVFDVARRVGKSTTMLLLAVEECIRRPKAMVKFGAATQEMVKEIILPLKDWIIEDCPEELKPEYIRTEYALVFPNGSRMKLVGLDTQPDRLRGTFFDLALVDEAGFVAELEYVVQSILVPQMQGRPWSRILLGSTPPRSPSHKWSTRYVPEAKASGAYIHRTIENNPRLTPEQRTFFINEAGGPESVENRRENYAEHIADEELAIIPEFIKYQDDVVCEVKRPAFADAYTSLDPGFNDLSVALFGYHDFVNDRIVIESDLSLAKTNTDKLAREIRQRERELWSDWPRKDGRPNPYMRICDTDPRLISDMMTSHGIEFVATQKDNKVAAIQAVRVGFYKQSILIHPRCDVLIAHLRHGIWNTNKTDYERSGDYGHFDAIDALVYLVRNVHKGFSPFPTFMNGEKPSTHMMKKSSRETEEVRQLKKLFAPRRRFI